MASLSRQAISEHSDWFEAEYFPDTDCYRYHHKLSGNWADISRNTMLNMSALELKCWIESIPLQDNAEKPRLPIQNTCLVCQAAQSPLWREGEFWVYCKTCGTWLWVWK
jgi:hypothetical protein